MVIFDPTVETGNVNQKNVRIQKRDFQTGNRKRETKTAVRIHSSLVNRFDF